jgi:hypothetical protein
MYVCVCCILSEFYTAEASALLIEAVNSYFHLYGCGYHHNRIDEVPLSSGTSVVVDGVIEMYLRYYDRSTSLRL